MIEKLPVDFYSTILNGTSHPAGIVRVNAEKIIAKLNEVIEAVNRIEARLDGRCAVNGCDVERPHKHYQNEDGTFTPPILYSHD